MLLGHGAAGKTTLIDAIQNSINKKSTGLSNTESTIGYDEKDLKLSNDINFRVFDFAGDITKDHLIERATRISNCTQVFLISLQHYLLDCS